MFVILPRRDEDPYGPVGPVPLARVIDTAAVRSTISTLSREGHGDRYVVVSFGACTPRDLPDSQMWDVRQPIGMPRPLGYMPESYARPWVAAARLWLRTAA